MRPRGSGTIHQRGPDRFEIKWRQGGRRRSRIVRGAREDAERVLDNLLAILVDRGSLCGTVTVRDYAKRYLDAIELGGFRSIDAARSRYRQHLCSATFIDWPLDSVHPRHVRAWADEMRRARLSPQSARHCLFLLSAIMRDAIEHELVDSNPVAKIRKPRGRTTRRERVVTPEQLVTIEGSDDVEDPIRWVLLALAGTGLRPGELLGLELADVHTGDEAPHLLVRRSGRRRQRTKTDDRVRRVELFGLGLRAVRQWLALRPRLRIKRIDVRRSRWAFPIPPGWLRLANKLGAALEAVAIVDIHAHDLRGTCATHLLSGSWGRGWSIAEVAAHLGDSISTTERNYAHVVPSRLREAADQTRGSSVDEVTQARGIIRERRALRSQRPRVRIAPGAPPESLTISRLLDDSHRPNVDRLAAAYMQAAAFERPEARELSLALAAAMRDQLEGLEALCADIESGHCWDRRAFQLATLLRPRTSADSDEEGTG